MAQGAVQIKGLRELVVALNTLYPELYAALNLGLEEVAKQAADSATIYAALQGFAPPGRSGRAVGNLIGSIRSGVAGTHGYIADSANRKGYYYPARYEYESGGARAFMRPAVDNNRDRIYGSIAAIVSEAMKAFDAA